ncbi:MAG: hypothetical protein FJ297_05915 [Planctomycetes bacterium]|nr:hypothetical protein [Planctomycetota bacterium]
MANVQLPYGVHDLDPQVIVHPNDPNLIRCYVRGCQQFVRRPTRHSDGELCPDHGIYCHHSRFGSTYSYRDASRNIIASPDVFANSIVGHPFKYESHRLGAENSEDALSWNVFRSLQEAGLLANVAKLMIGEEHRQEPDLYLWGIQVNDDSFEPWDLLIAAREQFESNLPVKRPLTEPDIALHLPGEYLLLIEAKFTSPNPCYTPGKRKDLRSLTLRELLDIYWDSSLQLLDYGKACSAPCIHYQLWRNTVFAEWMSARDNSTTRPYHVNLVRRCHESQSALEFTKLVRPQCRDKFRRAEWEGMALAIQDNPAARRSGVIEYIDEKTAGLTKAFEFTPER